MLLVLLLGIGFSQHLCLFLELLDLLLDEVCQLDFHEERALAPILAVAVANPEEVLVESLAHVRGEDEVVLVLFVGVVDAEAFPSGVGEPGYYIILYNLGVARLFVSFQLERLRVLEGEPVVVVYALVLKRGRLRDHPTGDQTLDRSCHGVVVAKVGLVVDQRAVRLHLSGFLLLFPLFLKSLGLIRSVTD